MHWGNELLRVPDDSEIDEAGDRGHDRDSGESTGGCGHCGAPTAAGRKFCAACGKPLFEPCPGCGAPAASGERFCGHCGADLIHGVEQRIEAMQQACARVTVLRAAYRFDEAARELELHCQAIHPALRTTAARAAQLMEEVVAERAARQAEVEAAWKKAQELFGRCDYRGAAEALERVALPLRSAEAAALLAESEARRDESEQLLRQLRDEGAKAGLEDVLARLSRLLELQPDQPLAREWAARLGEQFRLAAGKALERGQYDKAREMIDRVPAPARNAACEELRERIDEIEWLRWDLQAAPVATPALQTAAQRLRELVPRDAAVMKAAEELDRRLADDGAGPVAWAASRDTPLGPPVEWLTGFRRIEFGSAETTPLRQRPGCFFVASGLALQALGLGPVSINLAPAETASMLGRVARLARNLSARSAWGLDLGPRGLKAVKLALQGERVTLAACVSIDHRKPLSQALNENERETLVQDSLQKFLARQAVKAHHRVALNMPGNLTLARLVAMPPMTDVQRAKAARFEAQRLFPLPLPTLVWGHQLLEAAASSDAAGPQPLLLVAATRTELIRRLQWLRQAGIEPDLVQSDCLALHNFQAFDHAGEDGEQGKTKALVDIGEETLNVVISAPSRVWFRSTNLGAGRVTSAMARSLDISLAAAELLQREPARAPKPARAYAAMHPVFDEMLKETRRALEAYQKEHHEDAHVRLWAVGDGFLLHGLLRHFHAGR